MVSGHLAVKKNRWYAILCLRHPDGRRYDKWIATGLSYPGNKRKAEAMIGSIGNPVLVKKDREFCIKNMALFKRFANTDISMRYVYWFLFYAQYKLKKEASGGVQSFISLSRFREYLIPLPPVAEQNRIVAKLEEILPLCERLK